MVAPEAGLIVLLNHPEDGVAVRDSEEGLPLSHAFDLNIQVVVDQDDHHSDSLPVMGEVGAGGGQSQLSRDSDLFNLLPIIEAVTRGGTKRS